MSSKIAEFLENEFNILLKNESISAALQNTNTNVLDSKTAREKLNIFIEEAEVTVGLINLEEIDKNTKILEVGAGIGICFIYLQKMGYNITGIEPAGNNIYSEYQKIAKALFTITKVDKTQWHPYSIEDSHKLNNKYDLILSNFVLEHVNDTEVVLVKLYEILNPQGKMIHNTVNYNVPYEPHLNIILFPISLKQTERILPSLKENELWKTLNFISYSQVKKIAKKHHLNCEFEKNTSFSYLERLIEDEEFRKRKTTIYKLYRLLKKIHVINLAKYIPIRYNTPMTFRITK